MTTDDILGLLRIEAIRTANVSHGIGPTMRRMTDKSAAAYGPTSAELANRSGIPVSTMKSRLRKMELANLVVAHRVSGGYTTWWPLGLAQEVYRGE